MDWNPDGPNVVELPAGATELKLFPTTHMLRIPTGKSGSPKLHKAHLVPKLMKAGVINLRIRLPEGASGEFTLPSFPLPKLPRTAVTGVSVWWRGGPGERWERLADFVNPDGMTAREAKLAAIKED
jgi:hypothetical protein